MPADDRQRVGMDGERFHSVPRICRWSLQRIFSAVVWRSQGFARRMLGDALPSDSQCLQKHPDAPIIVALTGTDLYRDVHRSRQTQNSLKLAEKIVVLHPGALRELNTAARRKAHVIYQSVEAPPALATHGRASNRSSKGFDVCVIGHLRPVKDPFRAVLAARLLPPSSEIRIAHIGGAMTRQME